MTFPILLGGILLAAAIFGATLYSAAQSIRTTNALRYAHITLIAATLAGMTSIQFLLPTAATIAGIVITVAAICAFFYEQGASKLLPAIQCLFGIVLALGLPFAS